MSRPIAKTLRSAASKVDPLETVGPIPASHPSAEELSGVFSRRHPHHKINRTCGRPTVFEVPRISKQKPTTGHQVTLAL